MIVPKEYLVPLLNAMARSNRKEVEVFEGHRQIGPILSCTMEGMRFPLRVIDQASYDKRLIGNIEELPYKEMVNLIVKGSGFYPPAEIDPIRDEFEGLTKSRKVSHGDRPVWCFFDTCAIMNNIPYVFRRTIKGDMVKTTSMGVQNEIEEKIDMRFKSRDVLERHKEVFRDGIEDFFNQPLRIGRMARLCYGELDLLRRELGRDIIEDSEVGDTAILNGFQKEARRMNVDGVVVSCDKMMVERALEHGMLGWYLAPTARIVNDLVVKMSDLALMIYRASVLYGKVLINEDIVIKGIWNGKDYSDWKGEKIWVGSPFDKDIMKLRQLLDEIG